MVLMRFRAGSLRLLLSLVCALTLSALLAPPSSAFSLLGTAWDPGAASARVGGNPAPGGATWSVMAAGVLDSAADDHSPAGAGNTATTDLSVLYAGGVSELTTINLTLDKWAAVSGFSNLGQVTDGGGPLGDGITGFVGDIRIGAIFIDGGSGSNVLAHAFGPGTTASFFATNNGGDAHFDNSNTWADCAASCGGAVDFYTVALHEFGHSLGLGHSDVVGSVMEPIYAGPRRTLHADDIAGIQAIYGVTPEPSTALLLVCGLAGLAARRQRREA